MENNVRIPNPMRERKAGEKEIIDGLKKQGINSRDKGRKSRHGGAIGKKRKLV